MTLHCEWLVLCEQVLQDKPTDSLTLVNCLDVIAASGFPALHPRFAFAAKYRWVGESLPDETAVAYRFTRISDHEEDRVIAEVAGRWTPPLRTGRVVVNFQGINLARPETLRFRIDHQCGDEDWTHGPEVSLVLLALTPPSEDVQDDAHDGASPQQ